MNERYDKCIDLLEDYTNNIVFQQDQTKPNSRWNDENKNNGNNNTKNVRIYPFLYAKRNTRIGRIFPYIFKSLSHTMQFFS